MTPSHAPAHAHDTLAPLAAELNQDKVTPGLLGFVIFAGIAIALWLLMKNMGKQMKKVNFEERPADGRARSGAAPHHDPAAGPADAESPRS